MHLKNFFKNLLTTVFLVAAAQSATAQWQWTGKDGRKVFSDRPPPAEVAEKDILKRPAGAAQAATPTLAPATSDAKTTAKGTAAASELKASAPKLSGKDPELEAKKKKADEEEAVKKKAEEEKSTKTKAENCERGRSSLATLQSGRRISAVNAKGEHEVFDDDRRAAEMKRAQAIIDSNCN